MPRLRRATRRFSKRIRASLKRVLTKLRRINTRGRIILGASALALIGVIVLVAALWGAKAAEAAPVENLVPMTLPDAGGTALVDVETPTSPPVLTPSAPPVPTATPDPTLRRGCEGPEVKRLQERLMKLGFLDIDESTELFGPQTQAAVEQFQRQVNFTVELGLTMDEDGVAGPKTLELIYGDTAPKYVVKEGMSGGDIVAMQEQLVDLGYMKKTTGYYGTETIVALKDFQERNGLSVDGLAGPKTFNLLYSPEARESATKAKEARSKANISKMIEVAKKQLGDPYVRGARGPSSFDCSGLVYYCLKEGGSNRNRLNAAGYSQVSDWEKITKMSDLKRGDLIFFYDDGYTKVGHVGIVVGSGEMVDASSSNGKVVRRSYDTTYWRKHFVCGRRPW